MVAVAPQIPGRVPPAVLSGFRRFGSMADYWSALGEVPLDRILMQPLMGTATEADLLEHVERNKRVCELIDGSLVEKPVGSTESVIAGRLVTYLNIVVEPANLGVVYVPDSLWRLGGGQIRSPDVAFMSIHRLPGGMLPTSPVNEGAPDLAVEVISESNTAPEIDRKLRELFNAGMQLAWVVYPKTRHVVVYTEYSIEPALLLTEADTLDGGKVLPQFSIPVTQLFRLVPTK